MNKSIPQLGLLMMRSDWSLNRSLMVGATVAALATLGGCARDRGILGVDCCADIPCGAVPEPPGAKICHWETALVSGAAADQLVLYKADFVAKTAELSPLALDRLARLAAANAFSVSPVIVEPSGNDQLDAERTASVVETLASAGVEDTRVEIAVPSALGMKGLQAERLGVGIGGNQRSGAAGAPLSRPTARGAFGTSVGGGSF